MAGFLPIAKVTKTRQAGINLPSPPLPPTQVDDEYQSDNINTNNFDASEQADENPFLPQK